MLIIFFNVGWSGRSLRICRKNKTCSGPQMCRLFISAHAERPNDRCLICHPMENTRPPVRELMNPPPLRESHSLVKKSVNSEQTTKSNKMS